MKLAEIIENFNEIIPRELIKSKKVGSSTIQYIAWYDYCDLLDERCGIGNWSWSVESVQSIGENLTLVGKLTIYGEDKSLFQSATGCENLKGVSYGDPSSNAEAMAFKRACAKFGLARYLWKKEDRSLISLGTKSPSGNGQINHDQWLTRKNGGNLKLPTL